MLFDIESADCLVEEALSHPGLSSHVSFTHSLRQTLRELETNPPSHVAQTTSSESTQFGMQVRFLDGNSSPQGVIASKIPRAHRAEFLQFYFFCGALWPCWGVLCRLRAAIRFLICHGGTGHGWCGTSTRQGPSGRIWGVLHMCSYGFKKRKRPSILGPANFETTPHQTWHLGAAPLTWVQFPLKSWILADVPPSATPLQASTTEATFNGLHCRKPCSKSPAWSFLSVL